MPNRGLVYTLLCIGLLAVGWYLWTVHRQHLGGLLFYAFALICPIMHFFGHSHAGHHREDHGRRD